MISTGESTLLHLAHHSPVLAQYLIRMTKEEIRLCWCEILVQDSEEYGDLFPLKEYATPWIHEDEHGLFPYFEWFLRAIRYTHLEGGHDFRALRVLDDGQVDWKREEGWLCEPNALYIAHFEYQTADPVLWLSESIDFVEERGLSLPLDHMKALYQDVVRAVEVVTASRPKGYLDELFDFRAEALKSLGIRVMSFIKEVLS
jgi:hypothetical protein